MRNNQCQCGHSRADHYHPDYRKPEWEGREQEIDARYKTSDAFWSDCVCEWCNCTGFFEEWTFGDYIDELIHDSLDRRK